jgi:ketosteroid isomerase-like protein
MNTQATLVHHLQALGGGQLEAVLSDYSEESVIFTANGVFKGQNAIQLFFEATIKNTPQGVMAAFTMIRQDIEGEVAYILWKAEPFIPLATDTFVVRNGKIMAKTFTAFTA